MPKKKLNELMVVKLWSTCRVAFEEKLFSNAVLHVIDGSSQAFNSVDTHMCTAHRHKACVRSGKCNMCAPRCTWDELHMVGKKGASDDKVTVKDREKIERHLKKLVDQCRELTVVIATKGVK